MNFAYIIMGQVGTWQIIIIVLIVLLLFGGRKIPELMRGLGSGIKEFKDATKDEEQKKSEPQSDQNPQNQQNPQN